MMEPDGVLDSGFNRRIEMFSVAVGALTAAKQGDMLQVQRALRSGEVVDQCDENGWTLLQYAVKHKSLQTLSMVCEHNGIYDVVDVASTRDVHPDQPKWMTPLMFAAITGWCDAVEPLTAASADVNCRCSGHRPFTPLHFAAYHGHPSVVEALLRCGANANARDEAGRSALAIAVDRSAVACIKIPARHTNAQHLQAAFQTAVSSAQSGACASLQALLGTGCVPVEALVAGVEELGRAKASLARRLPSERLQAGQAFDRLRNRLTLASTMLCGLLVWTCATFADAVLWNSCLAVALLCVAVDIGPMANYAMTAAQLPPPPCFLVPPAAFLSAWQRVEHTREGIASLKRLQHEVVLAMHNQARGREEDAAGQPPHNVAPPALAAVTIAIAGPAAPQP